jgi:predicted house-cleaning NTP pyrophosphatase (Maf/HAM1 superfamily)
MSSRSRGNIPRRGTLVLASTSPQRRAILDQLRIPYEAVAPRYEEHDPPEADPVELVCASMLAELAGRTHAVLSGLCLLSDRGERVEHAETLVTFRAADEDALAAYVASGEWEGRAGGYAIQGLGGRLVERIDGDYLNVVGLPGALLLDVLESETPVLLRLSGTSTLNGR